MKAVIILLILLAGMVSATPAHEVSVKGPVAIKKFGGSGSSAVVSSSGDAPVGTWMTLFLMHNKWNPETKRWEKRTPFVSVSRGTYDFKTKTWTAK